MGGGIGGGAPTIPQRNLGNELNQIFKQGFPIDLKTFRNFRDSEPLLNLSNQFALGNLQNVGQLIDPLQKLLGTIPGQFEQYQGDLSGFQKQLGGFQNQLGQLRKGIPGQFNQYQSQLGSVYNRTQGLLQNLPNVRTLTNPLQHLSTTQTGVYNSLLPILRSQGALTGEQQRNVDQATRAAFAARGNVMGNQALGAELLNRDQYRQQRFGDTLQQALGLSGSIGGLQNEIGGLQAQNVGLRSGLLNQLAGITNSQAGLSATETGLLSNILGQQAGVTGQQAGITGQQAGLLGAQAGLQSGLSSGIQSLQSGALQQALGTEQSSIGSYASLINPLLAYGQDVNSSNQNAAAAQNIAGANKSSGMLGGAMNILGSIAAAY